MRNLIVSIVFSLVSLSIIAQGCLPDGILFTTQAEIDNFKSNNPNCTEIEGAVEISGNDITNLDSLHQIIQFDSSLEIYSSPNLVSIGGLSEVVSIGGRLVIANTSLSNLNGLGNLETIGMDLFVENNASLTSMMGLNSLSTAHGVSIKNNDALSNLTGMETLTDAGASFYIESNSTISSLSGIENIVFSTDADIWIYLNPMLTECEISGVCNFLDNQGVITFSENASGCNTIDEVRSACASSINEIGSISTLSVSPNPFTSSTTIEYTLKQPSSVQLSVFNQLGQLVYQHSEDKQQGEQQLRWDAQGLAEGVYYYRLKAGDQVVNGKLVKVR